MPQFSENEYLQSLLENLITSYETEINYNPIEIEVNSAGISNKDIGTLFNFVNEPRKRLFLFKISGEQVESEKLALAARKSILNATAATILKNTSNESKIYPLKKTLSTHSSSVRPRIQIQKSFDLPPPPDLHQEFHCEQQESLTSTAFKSQPIDLLELPELKRQLKALGIESIDESALKLINTHDYAFKDGIIPHNLPKGFYLDFPQKALCFSIKLEKLPSPLAPILNKVEPLASPSIAAVNSLFPTLPQSTLSLLMENNYSVAQKNALISQLPRFENEFKTLMQILKTHSPSSYQKSQELIVQFLCCQFILGGEAHTALVIKLIHSSLIKNIDLEFLMNPQVQNSVLSTRGIKNWQKLLKLPAEQKEWWNTLVNAHLHYDPNSFDFNVFFEAYTQFFLPRIAERNITLSNICPIDHEGHLLITLNRILDVIEHATNPQEQCLSLANLDWGATGVHYAMLQQSEQEKFKQVASCMQLLNPEDVITNPDQIYQELKNERLELKPWLFRFMGQHWKTGIRLVHIQAQLFEVEKLTTWTQVQRNQLIFILTCTFADKAPFTVEQWNKTFQTCISSLELLEENERNDLLDALTCCYRFKPNPSLEQINTLIIYYKESKKIFPYKNFKEEIITPLVSCLEKEGFELLNTLQARIQKTDSSCSLNEFSVSILNTFFELLQNNRTRISPLLSKLLSKLNEPTLTQNSIELFSETFQKLNNKKGDLFLQLTLNTLNQINIEKSQALPNIEHIQTLIDFLANSPEIPPNECNTLEKREEWLKNLIIDKNLLPDCVLGNGDISKLDDLIVDALVDAVKKRSAAFKVDSLKLVLQKKLESYIVPAQLKNQLNNELMPLFDAVNDLVILLQTPNPRFSEVIDKFKFFEDKKPILLDGLYGVGILGKTKGEYILSYLLTGKKKATDTITGTAFAAILSQVHGLLISEITDFFNNPENQLVVKDLNMQMALSWMKAFNETHSLTFFFKEELVEKKIVPVLKKTLKLLNIQDPIFEQSILDEASHINEEEPSDKSLHDYKKKIESIANYLNLLIDIKERLPSQFMILYKLLNNGTLARLNCIQKYLLINNLVEDKSQELEIYLKQATQIFEEYPHADNAAIERAIHGIVELFRLSDLDSETQMMFFKMSMVHSLKSTSPFPLAALNEFKKSALPEAIKPLIIKPIIQILLNLSGNDSSELMQGLVQQTELFLSHNEDKAGLCIALLNRISKDNLIHNLTAYPLILQQLTQISQENREKITFIINALANNKKEYTINLFALLEIIKGLGRRSSVDIDHVLKLFGTLPYPDIQNLNTALLAHDSEQLRSYCLNFDTNPFAKTGEKRDLAKQFATNRVKEALLNVHDLIEDINLPPSTQIKLAKQLTFIEILGYTDPLKPNDFKSLKKLTAYSRDELKTKVNDLLQQLRLQSIPTEQNEIIYLELIAFFREIYFRTTGLFPNTTQILVLLLSLHDPSSNLLMRINTGEGKSINAPMLSALQWVQGGTVDQCTANSTLLLRDFENNCEPFFKFLGIRTALIQRDSSPENYQIGGINCSTVEDMAIFRLAAKEAQKENFLESDSPFHIVLDECDDALLDQVTLYKLVTETNLSEKIENNPAEWIYPLTYQFINLPTFRNIDASKGKIWDEDEDLEQFRLFLNKEINNQFNGNFEKQNYLLASSNTQLKQWIHASCIAATLIENKHFIVQPLKEKDESGNEITRKINCVPLIRSIPKTGSIFTEAVQQALQARLKSERKAQEHLFEIDTVPSVLSSQSSHGLIKFYQSTKGRLLGISATPGDKKELENLATSLGTQAISVAPYAEEKRKNHPPIFTFSREESIQAICSILDKIKCPITKPMMELNPNITIQTLQEHEDLIAQTKSAIKKWSDTQTQPVLIIAEDFDEAQIIGTRLKAYSEQGFKIQIISGKESQSELDQFIKLAGQVNTITVGTAMLAKGIDINTEGHPKGLLVIQTYPDTERMTTQIAGRAARNGQPGEWLPIYQINPPKDLINRFFYFIFPWRRQRINEHNVMGLRNKIKLQATVDRLYTKAIDEAQQILMQQIEAWESLLIELYPKDIKIKFEFYKWREALLSELTRSQETSVCENTLLESIKQFNRNATKIWEVAREERWAAKAEKAAIINDEQNLRLQYLKQIDFSQELKVQSPLMKKSRKLTLATSALMEQNLETVLADKAGIAMEYSNASEKVKKDLTLAQSKQILPKFIEEFCTIYPEAIATLFPKNSTQNAFFVPEIINKMINIFIEQKNKVLFKDEKKKLTELIIQTYQNNLSNASSSDIQKIVLNIKPLMLKYCSELTKLSLVEQFKMQGLILSFCSLYKNLELPQDIQLNNLQLSYQNEVMKKLAHHLLRQFAWCKEKPTPFHAFIERTAAKEAASDLYNLAKDVLKLPNDKIKIQNLYSGLQKHKIILEDKYLFSINHASPRNVIQNSLDAINALLFVPHCDSNFRNECYNKEISNHEINLFRNYLVNTSPYFFNTYDPIWEHLQKTLLEISTSSLNNPSHVVQELYEATKRFSSYGAYKPYLREITFLKNKLQSSLKKLHQKGGLKYTNQEIFFTQKADRIARLFKLTPEQVHIQSGSDGLQSYIELQIDNIQLEPTGFTKYSSSFLKRIEAEKKDLEKKSSLFEEHKNALINLSDINALSILPDTKREDFAKLFRMNAFLNTDWSSSVDYPYHELPDSIQKPLQLIEQLKVWDWTIQPINLNQLQVVWGKEPDERLRNWDQIQRELIQSIEAIQDRIKNLEELKHNQLIDIEEMEQIINAAQEKRKQSSCGYFEKINLLSQILFHQRKLTYLQNQRDNTEQIHEHLKHELKEVKLELCKQKELLDKQRQNIITDLISQGKSELTKFLKNTSQEKVKAREHELNAIKPTIHRIEQTELKKSRYKTLKFFTPGDLLRYEALLSQEEEKIPKQTAVRDPSFEDLLDTFIEEPQFLANLRDHRQQCETRH